MNDSGELKIAVPSAGEVQLVCFEKDSEEFLQELSDFKELMMMYDCAIKETSARFEILNSELLVRNNHSPISFIKSRLKKPESILNKLKRRGYAVTVQNIRRCLDDVAGIRIICAFIDDIYDVMGMFQIQDDIRILQVKDYIKNPKPNGYRSFHMIAEIPVFFSKGKVFMKVEIQIRTIAMDFWASLEHQMKYKKDVDYASLIVNELSECADIINQTDMRMQDINHKIRTGTSLYY